jgi:hypothetical protein
MTGIDSGVDTMTPPPKAHVAVVEHQILSGVGAHCGASNTAWQ